MAEISYHLVKFWSDKDGPARQGRARHGRGFRVPLALKAPKPAPAYAHMLRNATLCCPYNCNRPDLVTSDLKQSGILDLERCVASCPQD